jgi:hypothetical protein
MANVKRSETAVMIKEVVSINPSINQMRHESSLIPLDPRFRGDDVKR